MAASLAFNWAPLFAIDIRNFIIISKYTSKSITAAAGAGIIINYTSCRAYSQNSAE